MNCPPNQISTHEMRKLVCRDSQQLHSCGVVKGGKKGQQLHSCEVAGKVRKREERNGFVEERSVRNLYFELELEATGPQREGAPMHMRRQGGWQIRSLADISRHRSSWYRFT